MTPVQPNTQHSEEDANYRTLFFLWIALMTAAVLYVLVANGYARMVGYDSPPLGDLTGLAATAMAYGPYVVGGLLLVGAYWARRRADRPSSDPLEKYRIQVLISLSLCEGAAAVGFASFVGTADHLKLYILCGAAVLAMLYMRPKKQEIVDVMKRPK